MVYVEWKLNHQELLSGYRKGETVVNLREGGDEVKEEDCVSGGGVGDYVVEEVKKERRGERPEEPSKQLYSEPSLRNFQIISVAN